MIIQITITRNELFLIKEMLPIWKKYADAFIFLVDRSNDGTYEYLNDNKKKYNILNILKTDLKDDQLSIESNIRQELYDEAFKYSGNIICLDTDEYLDGLVTKETLEEAMEKHKDTIFYLPWIQYIGKNEIRVDGPWKGSRVDRVASYSSRGLFKSAQTHSEHLPQPSKQANIDLPYLFVAHLQWLDKETVAVKQYFWKITDYVNNLNFGINTVGAYAYDRSVNNFQWSSENFDFNLKIPVDIYKKHNIAESYKYKFIKENIKKYNIPNLNDWGMGIHCE
jgi:hypothetical protein